MLIEKLWDDSSQSYIGKQTNIQKCVIITKFVVPPPNSMVNSQISYYLHLSSLFAFTPNKFLLISNPLYSFSYRVNRSIFNYRKREIIYFVEWYDNFLHKLFLNDELHCTYQYYYSFYYNIFCFTKCYYLKMSYKVQLVYKKYINYYC